MFKKIGKNLIITVIFISLFSVPYDFDVPVNAYANENLDIENQKISDIIQITNQEREKYGLSRLNYNSELARLAEIRVIDMKFQSYFDHINPQEEGLDYFAEKIEYDYQIIGENLAMDYFESQALIDAWLSSKSHRENMLKPAYEEIGIAQGKVQIDGQEKLITVMILGKIRRKTITWLIAR